MSIMLISDPAVSRNTLSLPDVLRRRGSNQKTQQEKAALEWQFINDKTAGQAQNKSVM